MSAHEEFEAVMNSGAPIVDMIGDSRMEYDGPRCVAEDCTEPVDNDNEMCETCGDQPHEFQANPDPYWQNWCVCGRIRSIGGHSSVHTEADDRCPSCRGVGGWQQPDGLIIECPRGCMTRDGAA